MEGKYMLLLIYTVQCHSISIIAEEQESIYEKKIVSEIAIASMYCHIT